MEAAPMSGRNMVSLFARGRTLAARVAPSGARCGVAQQRPPLFFSSIAPASELCLSERCNASPPFVHGRWRAGLATKGTGSLFLSCHNMVYRAVFWSDFRQEAMLTG